MVQSITLYCPGGSSDFVYRLCLKPRGGGYVVNLAHGLRDAKLHADTATPTPVHYDHAQQIYAELVAERSAQGYLVQERAHRDAERGVALRPIRPTEIAFAQVGKLISHPDWWLQEKLGGKHLLIRKTNVAVDGVDGTGAVIRLPDTVMTAARLVPYRWVIEGVYLGGIFTVFDLVEFEMLCFRSLTYTARSAAMQHLLQRPNPHLRIAETAKELVPKLQLLERLRKHGRSRGIVLRKLNGVSRRGGFTVDGYLLQCSFQTEPAPPSESSSSA